MSSPDMKDSCATCRFHRKESRLHVEAEVFGSIAQIADEDDKVFICGLTSKEIGLDPIHCDAFEPSRAVNKVALDDVVSRAEARLAQRSREEER